MVDDVICNYCGRQGSKDGMSNHLTNPHCEDYDDCENYIRKMKGEGN